VSGEHIFYDTDIFFREVANMAREVCPACGAQVCLSCNDDVCPVCLYMAGDASSVPVVQPPRLQLLEGGEQRTNVRLVPRLVTLPPATGIDGRRWG
jgi:hypothetical protein